MNKIKWFHYWRPCVQGTIIPRSVWVKQLCDLTGHWVQGCWMLQLCDIIRTVPVISCIYHPSWWFPLKDAISITSFQPLLLFSHSIMSNSLPPRGLQHNRLPCPSPTPGVCSNSYSLSQWCHPIISSSVIPFSSCLQSFPASGPFPISRFFATSGQSIGASASTSSFLWIFGTDFH